MKELTPAQISTKKKQAKEDAAAKAMGFDTMRRLNTALANAYEDGTLAKLVEEIYKRIPPSEQP